MPQMMMMCPPQMMMQPQPGMMQPQPSMMDNSQMPLTEPVDSGDSTGESEIERRREEAKLDRRPLSKTYQYLGGQKLSLAQQQRLELVEAITDGRITCARCIRLNELDLDRILYILTDLPLGTRLADLRVKSKHDLKRTLQKEVHRLESRVAELNTTIDHKLAVELSKKYHWDPSWDYDENDDETSVPVRSGKSNARRQSHRCSLREFKRQRHRGSKRSCQCRSSFASRWQMARFKCLGYNATAIFPM